MFTEQAFNTPLEERQSLQHSYYQDPLRSSFWQQNSICRTQNFTAVSLNLLTAAPHGAVRAFVSFLYPEPGRALQEKFAHPESGPAPSAAGLRGDD